MYPHEHDVTRNRIKNLKQYLKEYWIFHWIFLLGSLTFVFILSTNYMQNLAPDHQYLTLAVSWGIIGALEYAVNLLGVVVFTNEVRKELMEVRYERKAYSLTLILSPVFGAIVGLIMYSTILLVLRMYIREVDVLLVIFLSSIAGFNYFWIINGYVVEKVFRTLNGSIKRIRWHMQGTQVRTIMQEVQEEPDPIIEMIVMMKDSVNVYFDRTVLTETFREVELYLRYKKMVFIAVIALVVLVAINFILGTKELYYIYLMQIVALNYLFWASYWLLWFHLRNDFSYSFAKVCIDFALHRTERDEVSKLRYIILGLNSYDRYLRKRLGLTVNNIRGVYSKIGCLSEANRNSEFKLIEQAFNESDKLQPLNHLSQFMQIKSEDFLTSKPLVGDIREWIVALVSAIPVVISLIQLFLPALKL